MPQTVQAKSGLAVERTFGGGTEYAGERLPADRGRHVSANSTTVWVASRAGRRRWSLSRSGSPVCAFYWLVPIRDPLGRFASLCFGLLSGYFSFVTHVYPWYMPPVTLFGLVAVVSGLIRVAGYGRAAAPVPGSTACEADPPRHPVERLSGKGGTGSRPRVVAWCRRLGNRASKSAPAPSEGWGFSKSLINDAEALPRAGLGWLPLMSRIGTGTSDE